MKIVNNNRSTKRLEQQKAGTVVQFNKQFHQDYPPNDLYIVLDVCESYKDRSDKGFRTNKTGITNLSTGKLSFVDPQREVTIMNAEVKVNGPVD